MILYNSIETYIIHSLSAYLNAISNPLVIPNVSSKGKTPSFSDSRSSHPCFFSFLCSPYAVGVAHDFVSVPRAHQFSPTVGRASVGRAL